MDHPGHKSKYGHSMFPVKTKGEKSASLSFAVGGCLECLSHGPFLHLQRIRGGLFRSLFDSSSSFAFSFTSKLVFDQADLDNPV